MLAARGEPTGLDPSSAKALSTASFLWLAWLQVARRATRAMARADHCPLSDLCDCDCDWRKPNSLFLTVRLFEQPTFLPPWLVPAIAAANWATRLPATWRERLKRARSLLLLQAQTCGRNIRAACQNPHLCYKEVPVQVLKKFDRANLASS